MQVKVNVDKKYSIHIEELTENEYNLLSNNVFGMEQTIPAAVKEKNNLTDEEVSIIRKILASVYTNII